MFWYWIFYSTISTMIKVYFVGQLAHKYYINFSFDPIELFGDGDAEVAKEAFEEFICNGMSLNVVIATFMITAILCKTTYMKVVMVCESKDDNISRFSKISLYIQIALASLLT